MNRLVTMTTLAGALLGLGGCVAEGGFYDQGYSHGYGPAPYAYSTPSYAPAPFWGPSYRGGGYRGDSYRGDGYRGDGYRGDGQRGAVFRGPEQWRGGDRGGQGHNPGSSARSQQQHVPQAAPQQQRGGGGGPMGGRDRNRTEQGAD